MMLTLIESRHAPFLVSQGVVVSALVHAAIAGVVVVANVIPAAAPERPIEEKVVFLIPVDRRPESRPQQENLSWTSEGEGGGDEGTEAKETESDSDFEAALAGRGPKEEPAPAEESFTPPSDDWSLGDTVLTVLEVDSAVARSPESAAPAYPPAMLEKNIEGVVHLQYVVDTLGLIDTNTVKVLESTNQEFTDAVRAALPGMRFRPAIVRSRKVRQLVQQPFTFKIQPSTAMAAEEPPPTRKP